MNYFVTVVKILRSLLSPPFQYAAGSHLWIYCASAGSNSLCPVGLTVRRTHAPCLSGDIIVYRLCSCYLLTSSSFIEGKSAAVVKWNLLFNCDLVVPAFARSVYWHLTVNTSGEFWSFYVINWTNERIGKDNIFLWFKLLM